MIKRENYINKLLHYKDKNFIKVITGLRRVGKSTILDLYIDELKRLGIDDEQILKLNFELPNTFNIETYKHLSHYVLNWAKNKTEKLYIILDEVGRVAEWEKAINAFHAMKIFDIYIAGSNADLLSSDLSTFLAGRYVEILIYPFSYQEFKKVHPNSNFNDYMIFGGIPSIISLNLDYEHSMNVLRDSFNSAVYQDILKRYDIRNAFVLEKLIFYIFANTTNTFSALSVSRYFKSENIKVSVDTILNYLKFIEDAFLIYRVQRNDIIKKKILKTEEKYFIVDHGIREAIIGSNTKRVELILENIVFIELLRRGYKVNIGKVLDKEIDFVVTKNNQISYYQVSYLMPNEETREREFGVYRSVADNYPKYVLSMDKINFSQEGITHINIENFLLNK